MLEIKYVRENLEAVKQALAKRAGKADFEGFARAEKKRRELLQQIEALRHQRNTVSDQIARMKRNKEDAGTSILEMRTVSERSRHWTKPLPNRMISSGSS